MFFLMCVFEVKYVLFEMTSEDEDLRLDRWFSRSFPSISHAYFQKCLRQKDILVDGQKARGSSRLLKGQKIYVFEKIIEAAQSARPPSISVPSVQLSPKALRFIEKLPAQILFQDDDLVIVNKPSGIASQGGTKQKTSMDRLVAVALGEPVHLVHRLDQHTSGALILARNPQTAAKMGDLFKEKKVKKTYRALCVGKFPHKEDQIDLRLEKRPTPRGEKIQYSPDGLEALTHYKVIEEVRISEGIVLSWITLNPLTGRMHQLRVHTHILGCPVMGDGKYGGKDAFPFGRVPLCLHAHRLEFIHPRTCQQIDVQASYPPHMKEYMTRFFPHAFEEKIC